MLFHDSRELLSSLLRLCTLVPVCSCVVLLVVIFCCSWLAAVTGPLSPLCHCWSNVENFPNTFFTAYLGTHPLPRTLELSFPHLSVVCDLYLFVYMYRLYTLCQAVSKTVFQGVLVQRYALASTCSILVSSNT